MLINVRLLQYASKFFTYHVPVSLRDSIEHGLLVQVPLGNRIVPAVVDHIVDSSVKFAFEVKDILSIYPFPSDKIYKKFLESVSLYSQTDSLYFLQRIQQFLYEKEQTLDEAIKIDSGLIDLILNASQKPSVVCLTGEQQEAYEAIAPFVINKKHKTFLLHGVTGSGKTEVYKKLITNCLAAGSVAILLLPEITLSLRFEQILASAFPGYRVVGFHSAVSVKQKKLLWQMLLQKEPVLIIGVHMPVLLPMSNLGLIIVDEEHDPGYQEKKHPKIHSRDMAILRAAMYGVPIVLGSATPSLQSIANSKKRGWPLLMLRRRYAGNFPTVLLVSLKAPKKRKHFWITNELFAAITDRLSKKEQTIIFLNRRGHSFFVQCLCSFVFSCANCSVSLTLHDDKSLLCHYCGYKSAMPMNCHLCGAHHDDFLKKGIGTQQVVIILQKLFPAARIERADLDSTAKKRSWAQTVQEMQDGSIDILVGTQSITKGYHFVGVTLVGVLWADLNLHFPVYNAAETALQQLIQVAGRAGRQSASSMVIVQSFDEHKIFNYVDELKYRDFCDQEEQNRIDAGYPPFKHIAEIELKGMDQKIIELEAKMVVMMLREIATSRNIDVQILGPIPAMVYKIKSVYSQKLYLKSFSRNLMIEMFESLNISEAAPVRAKKTFKSAIYFTIDPVS